VRFAPDASRIIAEQQIDIDDSRAIGDCALSSHLTLNPLERLVKLVQPQRRSVVEMLLIVSGCEHVETKLDHLIQKPRLIFEANGFCLVDRRMADHFKSQLLYARYCFTKVDLAVTDVRAEPEIDR
jgi:hypothetical protein